MARAPGNHGRVIPRDRELLWRLYWTENRSLVEVAAMFDVTHKSLSRVFDILDIPRRKRRTKGQSRWTKCIKCGEPVVKIIHSNNGSPYGKRCRKHQRQHFNRLAREERKDPAIAQRKRDECKRWYYEGPKNLNGESQWISMSRTLLRGAKRLIANPTSPEASRSLKAASELEKILRTSCRA